MIRACFRRGAGGGQMECNGRNEFSFTCSFLSWVIGAEGEEEEEEEGYMVYLRNLKRFLGLRWV